MGNVIHLAAVKPPDCLNDFALQPTSRYKLESIIDQSLPFPEHGVCGIVLYGLYGTGKTTMARLLPGIIETARTTNSLKSMLAGQVTDQVGPAMDYHACASGQNSVSLIQSIQNKTSFVPFNSSNLHYVILDEIDNLTDLAQASFKAIMNRSNVVFVMTTNHLEKLDMGIQNRSVLIDMNLPPPQQWRPILRRVFTDAGLVPPPDQVLDQTVVAGRGSARSIFSDVVLSANHRIRQGEAANDGPRG
jgi:DNA polymerase III delta prime subunit